MATFATKPEPQLAPDYTGKSQGITASPNTALGTLFEGLASTLDMGIKEADRATQEKIRNDIFDIADSVNAEFGVDSATDFQESPGSPRATPAALSDSARHLQGLQSQYERGALKESHYWARMNSLVRQLRGRYPGYRAEIDSMVSGIVGARPANALRSALFSEWNDAANASSQANKDYNELVEWAAKQPPSMTGRGYLPVDYFENPGKYSYGELLSHISQIQAEDGVIKANNLSMELQAKAMDLEGKTVERNFRGQVTSMVNGNLADASQGMGRTYAEARGIIEEAQRAAANGDPLPEEQLAQLGPMLANLRQTMELRIDQMANTPFADDPENTPNRFIDNETYTSIREQALAPIAFLENAVHNKDYGAALSGMAWVQSVNNQASRDLVKDIPVIPVLNAVSTQAGPDALSILLKVLPQVGNSVEKAFLDYAQGNRALGGGSILEDLNRAEEAGLGSDYYNKLIEAWQNTIELIDDDSVPQQVLVNNVSHMFGTDADAIFARMDDNSRFEYFKKVASPRVTQKMLKLRDAGETGSWELYQSWVGNAFVKLFSQSIRSLPGTSPDTLGVTVTWNKATGGFEVTGDPSKSLSANAIQSGPGGFINLPNPLSGMETQVQVNKLRNEFANLNSAIRTVSPIIQENGGEVGEEMLELLMRAGYDPNKAPDQSFIRGIDDFIGDALVNGLRSIGVLGAPEEAVND